MTTHPHTARANANSRPFLRKPRRKAHGRPMNALEQARFDSGRTIKQVAEQAGVTLTTVNQLELRRLAKNHPYIDKLAAAYGVAPEVVLEHCDPAKELEPKMVKAIVSGSMLRTVPDGKRRGRPPKERDTVEPGKRLAVAKKVSVTARVLPIEHGYDVARPIPKSIRQLMRALADSTNIAVLKKKRFLDLKAVPTREFAEMLSDYLKAKNIEAHIILTDDYGGHFNDK